MSHLSTHAVSQSSSRPFMACYVMEGQWNGAWIIAWNAAWIHAWNGAWIVEWLEAWIFAWIEAWIDAWIRGRVRHAYGVL